MGKKKRRACENGDAGAEAAAVNRVGCCASNSPLFAGRNETQAHIYGAGKARGGVVIARELASFCGFRCCGELGDEKGWL